MQDPVCTWDIPGKAPRLGRHRRQRFCETLHKYSREGNPVRHGKKFAGVHDARCKSLSSNDRELSPWYGLAITEPKADQHRAKIRYQKGKSNATVHGVHHDQTPVWQWLKVDKG